jgi:acyl carrier protein
MILNRTEILQQLAAILAELLDNAELHISEDTIQGDIEGWDSLIHIHLTVALEKYFNIRFMAGDMQRWKNVGEIIDAIIQKMNKNN